MDPDIDPRIIAFAGPPPADIDLNADTASSDRAAIIAVLILALLAIALRFAARTIQRTKVHMDDWIIVLGMILVGGTAGLAIAGGHFGAGKHIWAVKMDDLQEIYKILFAYTFLYAASCSVIKLSILIFYHRVFPSTELVFRASMIFGYFLSLSYPVVIWVTMGNACRPFEHFWTQFAGTQGTCIDINTFFLALGIINMINDFYILLIPIPQIFQLQMSLKKRLGITGIMMLGGFVCAASVVRIHFLTELTKTANVTRAMGPIFIWSDLEPCIAIVSACLPHLAPLRHIVRHKLSSAFGTDGSGSKAGTGTGSKQWKEGGSKSNGPLFTYGGSKYFGGERLRLGDHDDEVELTNRVTGGHDTVDTRSGSPESVGNTAKNEIHVQTSYTQTRERRT
ncbi:pth11-like integral membrane [Fusarium longipes]|uniref:Pth11-like integral membrane n=1 Tax=Fusarium longipes TaxID=694270 RepID=A0A395S9Y2_9HYPO|nr:pth11-like integral membrane [Fusarium longipes]